MNPYSRTNPFCSKIVSRHRLNTNASSKETWHVVLSLDGSGIEYRPGDSIGICPENDHILVDKVLKSLKCTGEEPVTDMRQHDTLALRTWLEGRANLAVCTRKFLQELVFRNARHLEPLLHPEKEEELKHFLSLYDVHEVLEQHPEANLSPQDLPNTLGPLLPRLYSIASSQLACPQEVHLAVSRVHYEVHGKKRLGVCSHFLCDMMKLGKEGVPIYLQPTKDFLLPEDNQVPLIMIGPGTGIAPFRAFMQERLMRHEATDRNWIFFGERNSEHDFFYKEFWQELVGAKKLVLDVAFSRDQEDKVYVQHRMWQQKSELWQWLQNGAKIYVCGDATHMAKDVDKCLQNIVQEELSISEESARHFLSDLRKQKRYLRDVY